MATTKHTPGPWSQGRTLRTNQTQQWTPEQWQVNQAIERRLVFYRFTSADEGRSRILVAQCDREEDAHLIAAAPELLEALKGLVAWADDLRREDPAEDLRKARAAIAKAEGNPL